MQFHCIHYALFSLLFIDIDECSRGLGIRCSHGCLNTEGSFTCTCKDGYYLSADGFTCFGRLGFGTLAWTVHSWTWYSCFFNTDHNECAIDNGGCDHRCKNYAGYFTCSCKDGYVLQSNGRTCFSEKGIGGLTTSSGYYTRTTSKIVTTTVK